MSGCIRVQAGPRLAPLLAVAALLAGCGDNRSAAVPAPFIGCWHQVAAASRSGLAIDDAQERGFLTIDAGEALFDLEGLPRGVVAISDFGGEPGLGSGRLALANGLRLYLSVGHGTGAYAIPGGSVAGDAGWLDVHVLRAGEAGKEEPVARLRLWSAAAVSTAALAAAARHEPAPPAQPTSVPPMTAPALSGALPAPPRGEAPTPRDCDRQFARAAAATGDQGLAAAAQTLLRLHDQTGQAQVDGAFRMQVLSAQRELLQLLEQARHGDAFALSEANHRAARLGDFTTAYAAWRRSTP